MLVEGHFISFVNQKWPATPLSGAREGAARRRHWKSESVDALQEKCFQSRCPGVAASYKIPKDGQSSWKICLPIFQDRLNRIEKNSTLGPATRPCLLRLHVKLLGLSWRLQQPPSVAWNATRVRCPTTTNCVANARHQHLRCGSRIKSDEGIVDGLSFK